MDEKRRLSNTVPYSDYRRLSCTVSDIMGFLVGRKWRHSEISSGEIWMWLLKSVPTSVLGWHFCLSQTEKLYDLFDSAGISLLTVKVWGSCMGEIKPQKVKISRNTCWRGTSLRQIIPPLRQCAPNYPFPFGLCKCARTKRYKQPEKSQAGFILSMREAGGFDQT